jgi:hypothetical protein
MDLRTVTTPNCDGPENCDNTKQLSGFTFQT